MHFEVLVEDASGGIFLKHVIPKILGVHTCHTFRVLSYKGVGRLPRNLKSSSDASKRILLDQLPRLLRGYGNSLRPKANHAVIVVVDNDDRVCEDFKRELVELLDRTRPAPQTAFRIAIEELEAWLLGDMDAIRKAYPKARMHAASGYTQDSICGTWERLADVLHPGGSRALKKKGFPHTGIAKCEWADAIAPHMRVETNASPSFRTFRDVFSRFIGDEAGC